MKQLDGKALYNAYATTNPHALEWAELLAETQKRYNDTAQALDKQSHYEEVCRLLVDYRAALETAYGYLGNDAALSAIRAELAERGASCGLWPSKESEEH